MMDHVAAGIHRRQDRLSIHQDLDCGLLRREEPEINLVQSRGNGQNHGLIFIPQEIFWASIYSLYLPWNREAILELAALP